MDSILILAFFSSGLLEKNRRVATFFKSVHFSCFVRHGPHAPRKKRTLFLQLQDHARLQHAPHAELEQFIIRTRKE